MNLRPIPGEKVRQFLVEKCQIPDYEAEIYEAFAQNNLGRAITLTSSEDFRLMMDNAFEILTNIKSWPESTVITKARALAQQKALIGDYLDLFTIWYRDVLLFKAAMDPDAMILKSHVAEIRRAAELSSYAGVETILSAIERAGKRLTANVTAELVMELLLLTMRDN
jgi:DNA polymerase-3 subunit delta'